MFIRLTVLSERRPSLGGGINNRPTLFATDTIAMIYPAGNDGTLVTTRDGEKYPVRESLLYVEQQLWAVDLLARTDAE